MVEILNQSKTPNFNPILDLAINSENLHFQQFRMEILEAFPGDSVGHVCHLLVDHLEQLLHLVHGRPAVPGIHHQAHSPRVRQGSTQGLQSWDKTRN